MSTQSEVIWRVVKMFGGLMLVGLGLILLTASALLGLILLGPLCAAVGGVICFKSAFPGAMTFSGGTVLLAGLILTALGICPMALLFLDIVSDNESTGMLTTILLVFVGVPGLLVILTGLCIHLWDRI